MNSTGITRCRVCGSRDLTSVIDLGEQWLQGSFVFPGKETPLADKFPTELVLCDKELNSKGCGLLQMRHSVDPDILYAAYWYRSGINTTMRNHLQNIVESILQLFSSDRMTVLDVGCNDGTLLKAYPEGTVGYGVDPSDIAKEIEPPITVISDLFPSEAASEAFGDQKFNIITSIAMFYDLESPVDFAKAIKNILSEDGIWVLEMSYLPLMLIQNSFDTICHEHLEFYSLDVLERIVDQAGLKIFLCGLNEINGGSIRCYVTPKENSRYDNASGNFEMDSLRLKERELKLKESNAYAGFMQRIEVCKSELLGLIERISDAGKTIHVYGASTKGNTLLQWYGIDRSVIPYAAERNPEKYGAKTLGTNIDILSEEESRAMNPDYYLILPWHFRDEFINRERAILQQGTRFIFPLPNVEVVDVAGTLRKHDWV